MDVRPGYKQTEVGVIPTDWHDARIGDISSIQVGRDLREECFSRIRDSTYRYPVFSNTVDQLGFYGFYSVPEYNGDSVTVVGRGVGLGTAFARSGGYGAIGRLIVLFPDAELDSSFLTAYINQRVTIFHESGGIPQLTGIQIAKYRIAVPPLAEQRAIAGALSDVDALIGALNQLIAKKRDLKQAAMQQLLTGQKRLPSFHGEWEVKPIKEVVQTPVTDGPHLTPEFLDDGVPFLSVNNLVDNKIDLSELRFISRSDHELFSRKCKPARNDLLLGKAASVGKVAFVDLDVEFNIWSPIALIRLNSQHSPKFFYYCFQSSPVIRQITLFTNSSSQGNLGMGDIEKLEFPTPSLAEQTAIADVLSDMDAELGALEQRRNKTRALKQGMMQELLTGKTRLV